MSTTTKPGKFSDSSIWDVPPDRNTDAVVAHTVVVDSHIEAKRLTVNAGAALGFGGLGGTLELWGSLVVNGWLSGAVGKILFHVADDRLFTGNVGNPPDPAMPDFFPDDIGLWGMAGSEIELTAPEVTPWLRAMPDGVSIPLAYGCTAYPAVRNGSATLERPPVGWQVGDRLVLCSLTGAYSLATLTGVGSAPVDLDPQLNAIEDASDRLIGFPTIPNIDASIAEHEKLRDMLLAPAIPGNQITYVADDPVFMADAIQAPNGRFVYPKIGNLTRRFQIIAVDVKEGDPNHRAHTAMMHGGCADLQNVEFRNLGPRGKLGRYPVHFHKMSNSPCCQAVGCSVWQDVTDPGSRFFSVHDSSEVKILNNVGLRSRGHGYFSETGLEANNEWTGNLSIDVSGREELTPIAGSVDLNGKAIVGPTNLNNATTSHYWLRSGSKQNGNVACGGNAEYGVILLPTKIAGTKLEPLTDWECHGIAGWPFWFGVNAVEMVNAVSTYALVSCTNTPIAFQPPATWGLPKGLTFTNPTLLFNGTVKTGPNVSYASALFLNSQKGAAVNGGVICGDQALSIHYTGDFAVTGTTINAGILLDPTYWELAGFLTDCKLTATKRLFFGNYPKRTFFGVLKISGSGAPYDGRFTHAANKDLGPGVPEATGGLRLTE